MLISRNGKTVVKTQSERGITSNHRKHQEMNRLKRKRDPGQYRVYETSLGYTLLITFRVISWKKPKPRVIDSPPDLHFRSSNDSLHPPSVSSSNHFSPSRSSTASPTFVLPHNNPPKF